MTSTVSIIIPTYNRSWGLRRAMNSVLRQSYSDFELIISDDASTDDTLAVVTEMEDARVSYHCQPTNRGVARNWGAGLELARGEFVAILMDDDHYEPEFLARRIAGLRSNPDALFAFSGWRAYDEAGNLSGQLDPRLSVGVIAGPTLLSATLSRACFVGATVYRAAALRNVWQQAEQAGIIVDYAANVLLAAQNGATAVFLGGSDFVMAQHASQVSRTQASLAFEATTCFLKSFQAADLPGWSRDLVRRELGDWLAVGARRARLEGHRWTAISRSCCALNYNPFHRASWGELLRSVTRGVY